LSLVLFITPFYPNSCSDPEKKVVLIRYDDGISGIAFGDLSNTWWQLFQISEWAVADAISAISLCFKTLERG